MNTGYVICDKNIMTKNILIVFFVACLCCGFNEKVSAQIDGMPSDSIDLLLSYSIEELMRVKVISSTKQPESLSEAPSIISVISSKQIKDRGYRSIAEALESAVGMDIITDHFQPNLGVRGVNGGMRSYSRIVKVMINGQTVSYRSSGDNYLDESLIPINIVDRIEIIRGPNSALYGSDAYLGVVNIITKKYDEYVEGDVSLLGGKLENNFTRNSKIVIAGKKQSFDYLFSGSISHLDRSGLSPIDLGKNDKYKGAESSNDLSTPKCAFAKLSYKTSKFGKFDIQSHMQYVDAFGEFQDWAVLTHQNRISLFNAHIRGSYSHKLTKKVKFTTELTYLEGGVSKNEDLYVLGTQNIFRESSYKGYETKTELLYEITKRNNITLGLDYSIQNHQHQTFYTELENGLVSKHTDWVKDVWAKQDNNEIPNFFSNQGVYAQIITSPHYLLGKSALKGLTFTIGARLDRHSVYGSEPTYRVATVYNLNKKIYTKLLWGTSFKAPSSTQLYTNYIKPRGVIGNPNLKPERAKIIDWQIGLQPTKNLFFSINAFNTIIEDKVELIVPLRSPTVNIQAHNSNEIESVGIELEFKHKVQQLDYYANYSYQESQVISVRENDPETSYSYSTNLYPQYIVKFGANHTFNKIFLKVHIDGKYIGARIASSENTRYLDKVTYLTDFTEYLENRYELSPYFLMDFMLSSHNLKIFDDNETKLSVKVKNLFNEEYSFPGFKDDFDIPGLSRSFIFTIEQFF